MSRVYVGDGNFMNVRIKLNVNEDDNIHIEIIRSYSQWLSQFTIQSAGTQ